MELSPLLVTLIAAVVLGVALAVDVARRSARDDTALRQESARWQVRQHAPHRP